MEEAIEGVFNFRHRKPYGCGKRQKRGPGVHKRFLEMLLKKPKQAATIRASQSNAIARLNSEDIKVILKDTQALNVGTKEKVLGLKKQEREAAVAEMREIVGDNNEMEVALISHKYEKEDAFKFITDLKGRVNNAQWVADENKHILRTANQEAEPKGKALKVIIGLLSNDLSKKARTERNRLAAKLEKKMIEGYLCWRLIYCN